eukprot:scaffold136277_cov31-Tisochrysis_lutea.AAC.2
MLGNEARSVHAKGRRMRSKKACAAVTWDRMTSAGCENIAAAVPATAPDAKDTAAEANASDLRR